MPLLSAGDDFNHRTLSAIDSDLKKLVYIASLRDGNGAYGHWGLERAHGPDAASEGIASNHSQKWLEVLRMPIQDLASEMRQMNEDQRDEVLRTLTEVVAPRELNGGTVEHFNSTVLALKLLFRSRSGRLAA